MAKAKEIELKRLEKELQRIERRKARLEEQLKTDEETVQWYNEIYTESECKSPRAFVKALMEHFGIRSISLTSSGGAGSTAATVGGAKRGRKPRTPITPELVQEVKAALKSETMSEVGERYQLSYPTVRKIKEGAYDKKKKA